VPQILKLTRGDGLKKSGRYDASDLVEAQYEIGSNDTVLRNLLRIIDSDEMDRVEAGALAKATDILIREYDQDHQFCAADIRHFHKTWLGEVYKWAGKYRTVNITKNNFAFAMAAQIHKLMALQAGLPLLDFNLISEYKKQEYITAVKTGLDRNYQPMETLFSEIIEKSISASTGE